MERFLQDLPGFWMDVLGDVRIAFRRNIARVPRGFELLNATVVSNANEIAEINISRFHDCFGDGQIIFFGCQKFNYFERLVVEQTSATALALS